MGGLWEAAVKSMKAHLRRVIGESTLTFEEMTTLLCRIEACLNSRPLTPLSDDPNDLSPLTPGHFLIGEPLRGALEPPPDEVAVPLTTRWSREYLHQLQQRTKWSDRRENLRPGTIVLLKDDLSPPTRWPMARVEATHPGKDGLVPLEEHHGARATSASDFRPLPVTILPSSTETAASADATEGSSQPPAN
ncbi:uncharacterized protein LOC143217542 [Lasioglossum baleicum]|uniref:uncharacterized protein LOC143217542 n=1 Tax=Lasioglossum baleicum TaxID=434251 RepID=UPI003FCEE156